ncbi:family with sequence similarity 50 member A [Phyllostomus discolor]|uniref:Family with sequence similarity 50 member A n=1 Tax=Phyllostomus discolor TaxID=89673 RepID=A0A833Z599_9CHIR|nr:family with sequence similarity 50 member A [Phyllostomus discolor]
MGWPLWILRGAGKGAWPPAMVVRVLGSLAGAWRPGGLLESPSPQTHVSFPTLWHPGCWLCGPLMQMKKGNTMQQFLQKALEILRKDFSELRSAGVEQLMYIKEDLIIPHHHSFYDFIVTKARGKSGPLFNFDVHDDVRLLSDATVEKDESHAGKVVLRSWYEKNKHIFPASRWEPYDPEKKWDKYTIR